MLKVSVWSASLGGEGNPRQVCLKAAGDYVIGDYVIKGRAINDQRQVMSDSRDECQSSRTIPKNRIAPELFSLMENMNGRSTMNGSPGAAEVSPDTIVADAATVPSSSTFTYDF